MSEINNLKPVQKLRPFTHFCMTIGNLPSSYLESMTYYEQIVWFIKFLEDTVIPTINNNGEAVEELQQNVVNFENSMIQRQDAYELNITTLYNQLKSYVDNYFDNLDVQEEINNKLDDMVEAGTLQEIIASYLNSKAIFGFDTVASMKNSENLIDGSYAKTLGYYSKNDNGSALYYITNQELTANNSNIIQLNNGLFAVLVSENNTIIPEQFGCYGNGINDDTQNLQNCIDFAIDNKKQINFCGSYKVSPINQEDGTKVCLKVFRDSSQGIHGSDTGISFNFIRESKIFTESTEVCTLLRLNIANINFENALLIGIQDKTTLLELSKIDKLSNTESQWSSYNIFRNLMLLNSKNAITMEGNTYYNTFDKLTIRGCTNGIILDFTALEKAGLARNSNVNRNDFSNITIQNSTGIGIILNYADTNKFTNISFEGCVNAIYLDDPHNHSSDFPISPSWYTEDNMFTNIIMESVSGYPFYNNSGGLKIINTSVRYQHPRNNFVIKPQVYVGGGANDDNSIEKIMDLWKSQEDLPFANSQKYSTIINSGNGHISKYYSDFQITNNTTKVLSRRNIPFDESRITNKKENTSLTYETNYKCITKQIGGIVFFTSKFSMQPNDLNNDIILPLDTSITHNNQFGNFYNLPALCVPVYVNVNNTPTLIKCEILSSGLKLHTPQNGWSNTITVFLNLHWFRDTLSL